MKKLNIEETRQAKGGGRYYCGVCRYTSNSYSRIFVHCAAHVGQWGLPWARATLRILKKS